MSRALVVVHDAGGAEVVTSWVRRHIDEHRFEVVAEGPAQSIVERKLPDLPRLAADAALERLTDYDFVLAGSGYTSTLEKHVVRAARRAGVRCATYLDHWTRYRDRFVLDGELVLPDEVWAGDDHALALVRELIPEANVVLAPNEYFADLVAAVEAAPGDGQAAERDERERVLYVTEPTARAAESMTGDPRGFGYDEIEALERYIAYLHGSGRAARLRIRPHPGEPAGKYDDVARGAPAPIDAEISSGGLLEEDIAWAQRVAGCDSMAMVVGVLSGRVVESAIPPGGRPLSLPFPEIVRIYEETGSSAADAAASRSARALPEP